MDLLTCCSLSVKSSLLCSILYHMVSCCVGFFSSSRITKDPFKDGEKKVVPVLLIFFPLASIHIIVPNVDNFMGLTNLYTDRESRELRLRSMQQFTEMPIHAWEIKRSRLLLWIWNIFKDTIVTWLLFLFFPCPFCVTIHPFSIFVYCSWWKRGLEANSKYSGIHWWN